MSTSLYVDATLNGKLIGVAWPYHQPDGRVEWHYEIHGPAMVLTDEAFRHSVGMNREDREAVVVDMKTALSLCGGRT